MAASASFDKTVKVWNVSEGRELGTLARHADFVYRVALSGDGRRAVSASGDTTLKVWDVESGRELRTLIGHSGAVFGVGLSKDGQRAVTGSRDRTLKVWDLESGIVATFSADAGLRCCVFAGGEIVMAGDQGGRVHLLRLEVPGRSVGGV